MCLANLIVTLLLVQVQPPGTDGDQDPLALVARLGAGIATRTVKRPPRRQHLGRAALPALLAARDSRDLEVRTRASGLIQKIEGALLIEPTRIRLDIDRMPLIDVVRSFSLQAGFKVALSPENLPRWKSTRVTLHMTHAVDFWRAVDQLRDVAGVQYNPGMSGYAGKPSRHSRRPMARFARTRRASDHGPFRVSLLGLHYQRRCQLRRDWWNRRASVSGRRQTGWTRRGWRRRSVQSGCKRSVFRSFAGCGRAATFLVSERATQVIESVDNRGNLLTPIASDGPAYNRSAGYFGMANGPVMQLQLLCTVPTRLVNRSRSFAGIIPVTISSRKPNPLVVSLIDGVGKAVEMAKFN